MTQTDTISEIELVYKPSISNKPIISSPLDAYNVFMDFYPKETLHLQEHFFIAYLNRFNRVLGVLHLSSGGITGTIADIRLIFGTALKAAASGLVISHNHPSGNLNPSDRDKEVTKKILVLLRAQTFVLKSQRCLTSTLTQSVILRQSE